MTGMKITVDAAMRARDVSRPHAEHEELAQATEQSQPAGQRHTPPAPGPRSPDSSLPAAETAAAKADATVPAEAAGTSAATAPQRPGRRRRRRR